MEFEWDPKKAASNLNKHGVSFDVAALAFDDPRRRYETDAAHSTQNERRDKLWGQSDLGLLVVVFTYRKTRAAVRIISARRANRRERKIHEAYSSAD